MDLKETDILGEKINEHWYYRSKAKAMMRLLSNLKVSTVLDVGAGSGFFSRFLLAREVADVAWCVDISYAKNFDALEAGRLIHFRRSVEDVNADLVLFMDVLEHVDDDVGLLRSYVEKVHSGSRFLISVPAFKFLWSGHDVFLGHKRRYTLSQIEEVVERAGLKVKHATYYFGAVFPVAATIRMFGALSYGEAHSQLRQHHPIVNEILAALSNLELPLMMINKIAGLTVFCLAEKI